MQFSRFCAGKDFQQPDVFLRHGAEALYSNSILSDSLLSYLETTTFYSYSQVEVEVSGLEPLASAVQGQRSTS